MLRLKEKKKSDITLSVVLTILLLAFLGLVFFVNLSCNPEYYDGDIYADISYAKEAWKAKSLFPKDWLFGNQLYVVATPVLAALFYGITHNGILAMGIASCVMSVLIVLTYDWMMKTVFNYNERTSGFLAMVGVLLIKAHIASGARGAQILFTMASYYSCYMITAFIVYGCYIRIRQKKFDAKHIPLAVIGTLLSFATGMQSLRQTVIMTLPLIVCEILMTIIVLIRDKKNLSFSSIIFTLITSAANLGGIIFAKSLPLQQTTIYGDSGLEFLFDLKQIISKIITEFEYGIVGSFKLMDSSNALINTAFPIFVLAILLLGFIINIADFIKSKACQEDIFSLSILLFFSCASVLSVSVFTSVGCKTIYYFMIFPFLANAVATIIKKSGKYCLLPESVVALLFTALIVTKGVGTWNEIKADKNPNTSTYQIAKYMTDNGYNTLYFVFGLSWGDVTGENVVAASGDRIYPIQLAKADGWENGVTMNYLHIKDNYKLRDDEKSLYVLNSENYENAKTFCDNHGIEIDVMGKYEDRYLCKLSKNVCRVSERIISEKEG